MLMASAWHDGGLSGSDRRLQLIVEGFRRNLPVEGLTGPAVEVLRSSERLNPAESGPVFGQFGGEAADQRGQSGFEGQFTLFGP